MARNLNNIVIGLLKNMLKKNLSFHEEGFKKFDEEFFKVVLDASGFDKKEVMRSMANLCANNKYWHKKGDKEYLSGDIWGPIYNDTTEYISFYIRNETLISLRNKVLNKV